MQMSSEVVQELAFDVGAGYFNDAQLCLRYDLTIGQLNNIRQQTAFKKELDEVRRVLEDGGDKFVFAARKAAMAALQTLQDIHTDVDAAASLRVRAAEGIIEVAGVKKVQQPGEGQKIIINTNLSIGANAKGSYVIEAKAHHPESQEMQTIATQAVAELPKIKTRKAVAHDPLDGSDLV